MPETHKWTITFQEFISLNPEPLDGVSWLDQRKTVHANDIKGKSESIQKENGTPVWYLAAKDEGHGFAKKKNADFHFYTPVLFMQKYLLG